MSKTCPCATTDPTNNQTKGVWVSECCENPVDHLPQLHNNAMWFDAAFTNACTTVIEDGEGGFVAATSCTTPLLEALERRMPAVLRHSLLYKN